MGSLPVFPFTFRRTRKEERLLQKHIWIFSVRQMGISVK